MAVPGVDDAVVSSAGSLASTGDSLPFAVVGALAGTHWLGTCGSPVATYADRITGTRGECVRTTTFDGRQRGLILSGIDLPHPNVPFSRPR
jgi:hypothetical protein